LRFAKGRKSSRAKKKIRCFLKKKIKKGKRDSSFELKKKGKIERGGER